MTSRMQFISTGAIECVEGGGHYRPNKHAELARDIFRALERLLERRSTVQELRLLARKTHTKCASGPNSSPSLSHCSEEVFGRLVARLSCSGDKTGRCTS